MFQDNRLISKDYLQDEHLQDVIYPIDFKWSKMYVALNVIQLLLLLSIMLMIYIGLQDSPKQQIAFILPWFVIFFATSNWSWWRRFFPLHYLRIERHHIYLARRFRSQLKCVPITHIRYCGLLKKGLATYPFYWVRIDYVDEQQQEKTWWWYVGHRKTQAEKIVNIIQFLKR